jgi:PAT family beta-lactamase induction signal transducer AmpG
MTDPTAAIHPGRPPGPPRALPRTAWVSSLYFAQGLPYMLVRFLAGVYLTDVGVREAWLGFLNFLGLPWNTKFLWAPLVDLTGTRRGWLVKLELAVAAAAGIMALCTALGPASGAGAAALLDGWSVRLFAATLVGAAFLAATHDVAIDGYYMEAIPEPAAQAGFTGLRVTAYRVAMVFAKSVLVALAAWLTWAWGFAAAALCLLALFVVHGLGLPRVQAQRPARPDGSFLRDYGRALGSWLDQPKVGLVLLFVVTYKLGDEVLFSMNTPFLLRELGVAKDQLAWMAGVLGTVASLAGSLLSAWSIQRWGLKRAIWPLTLGMNLNIWVYVWLAVARPDPHTAAGLGLIASLTAYEQFAAGLGNAVLVVYLMRTCKAEFKASHYAIASAIPSLGGTLFGGMGGLMVQAMGYAWMYVLAFVASLPSMACLLFLPLDDQGKGAPE